MYRKLLKEEWQELKQEHHIIRVLKFGKTDHMIQNAISGHWVALSIKWLLSVLLLEQTI